MTADNKGKVEIDTIEVVKVTADIEKGVQDIINIYKNILSPSENMVLKWEGASADNFARILFSFSKDIEKIIMGITEEAAFVREYCNAKVEYELEQSKSNY
jgi:hypothetical protein